MKNRTITVILIALILISLGLGIYFYPSLPDEIVSHWNTAGTPDDTVSKFWGVFLMPLIATGIFVLYRVLPRIDPLHHNIDSFRSVYNMFWVVLILFLVYVHTLTLFWNAEYQFSLVKWMIPALALFFYFLGTLLQASQRNWFVGIRTPWTLSSHEVWGKTNRLGGTLFKIAALLILGGLFFPEQAFVIVITAISAIALITIPYSYLEYRKINSW